MDKPLKDWTLEEAQNYCKKVPDCESCPLRIPLKNNKCPVDLDPTQWDLSDPPRWTEEELRDMEAIYRLYPSFAWASKDDDGSLVFIWRQEPQTKMCGIWQSPPPPNTDPIAMTMGVIQGLRSGETINIHDELRKAGRV